MSELTRGGWHVAPDNPRWIALGALACAMIAVVPALVSPLHVLVVTGAVISIGSVLFSSRRAVMAMLVIATALPVHLVDATRIPLGLRPWEVLMLLAAVFVVIDTGFRHGFRIKRTDLDTHVFCFLGVAVLSIAVGAMNGNAQDVILRNARYAFYYAAFFLVTQTIDGRTVVERFSLAFIVLGMCVSAEYILEFVGAIDLSSGQRFVRVARRQGIVFPLSLLMIVNYALHDRDRWGRWLPVMFVFTGIGFALTLGRGMWAAFGVGLLVSIWLWQAGKPARQRRWWKGALLAVGLVATLGVTMLAFQRITGTAISAHALERSRTFVDYSRDVQVLSRLLNYATALQEIAKHPILGTGQGTEVTSYAFNPDEDRYETWRSWTLDSLYLTLWLKMGLAGLILFVWMFLRVARRSLAVFRAQRSPPHRAFAAAGVSTLAAMLVLGISDGSMVNGRFAMVAAVLLGLLMVLDTERKSAA